METAANTGRKTYLDAIRILGSFFVIFNHVAGQSMRLFSGIGGATALFLLYISKAAIPLFIMVSGAAMLGREEPYGKFVKRAIRIVLALALVTLFYYGLQCLTERTPFVAGQYFRLLYRDRVSNSMWYLYAYLGLLIMMPILQRMTRGFGRNEYRYFAFWSLLFCGLMPILQSVFPFLLYNDYFTIPLFAGIIGMAVMGRCFDGMLGFTKPRTAAAILLLIAVPAACVALTMQNQVLFNALDNAFMLPAMTIALSLFYLIRLLDARAKVSERVRAGITHVGKLAFCSYLISDFVINSLQGVREALVPALQLNGAGTVYAVLAFIVCLLLSECLTRIPGLNKLL